VHKGEIVNKSITKFQRQRLAKEEALNVRSLEITALEINSNRKPLSLFIKLVNCTLS